MDNHVSGWHAVSEVAMAAGIDRPDLMTATGMRHYMGTKYATIKVPVAQRAIFYNHMATQLHFMHDCRNFIKKR